ncbi:MAG: class I SAM-dependent methyltransferase [Hymenobacteraceae bacterium]|nr:class I SAM-dependent methyltransferase [Hymenobacteraceae bacterium]
MKEFWNERYSQEEMIYGTEPNAFYRTQLSALKPGRLLLPAEGEGRNAVHAALKGWEVIAFDYSDAGKAKAKHLAAQRGVTINYQVAEAQNFETAPESLDAAALIFAHFPPAVRRDFHHKIVNWLKPGATLILEAFHPNQLAYTSGGPREEAMLYTGDMLRADLAALDLKLLEEVEITLNEGTYHRGAGFVTRLAAVKP